MTATGALDLFLFATVDLWKFGPYLGRVLTKLIISRCIVFPYILFYRFQLPNKK